MLLLLAYLAKKLIFGKQNDIEICANKRIVTLLITNIILS